MSVYLEQIVGLLTRIEAEEANALSSASDAVAEVICRDGLVHVFGCGHSHLAALDTFYRAGDTFSAVFAVRLAEGEALRDACIAANAAAAEEVTMRYVMPSIPRRHWSAGNVL